MKHFTKIFNKLTTMVSKKMGLKLTTMLTVYQKPNRETKLLNAEHELAIRASKTNPLPQNQSMTRKQLQ